MKWIVTLLFILFLLSGLQAQNFTGGLTSGLIASTINGDNAGGFRQAGLMAGAYVQYPLREYLYLQPEILFEGLGSRSDFGTDGLRTNYISFPVLLHADLNFVINDSKFNLGLEGGPIVGYLLGATDQNSGRNVTSTYERLDYRLAGGLLFKLTEKLHFSARSSGSVISFLNQGNGRSNCFNGFPRFCHYYFTFALRYQILSR
ncbi:MAG: PorT family protein [Bacteroidia bacterium]|nr:PorT family protein [Bacteroidia bacterium]